MGVDAVSARDLDGAGVPPSCRRLLVRTDNSAARPIGGEPFDRDFVALTADAADWIVAVLNWTPVVRHRYRIGVPASGFYGELLNSDAALYGGSNTGNAGGITAESVPAHGHSFSLTLTLPPLGGLILRRRDR